MPRPDWKDRDDDDYYKNKVDEFPHEQVVALLLNNGITIDVVPGSYRESTPRGGKREIFVAEDSSMNGVNVVGPTDNVVALWFTKPAPEPPV